MITRTDSAEFVTLGNSHACTHHTIGILVKVCEQIALPFRFFCKKSPDEVFLEAPYCDIHRMLILSPPKFP